MLFISLLIAATIKQLRQSAWKSSLKKGAYLRDYTRTIPLRLKYKLSTTGFTEIQKTNLNTELLKLTWKDALDAAKLQELHARVLDLKVIDPVIISNMNRAELVSLNRFINENKLIELYSGQVFDKAGFKLTLAWNGFPLDTKLPLFKDIQALKAHIKITFTELKTVQEIELKMAERICEALGLKTEVSLASGKTSTDLFQLIEAAKKDPNYLKNSFENLRNSKSPIETLTTNVKSFLEQNQRDTSTAASTEAVSQLNIRKVVDQVTTSIANGNSGLVRWVDAHKITLTRILIPTIIVLSITFIILLGFYVSE